MSIGAAGPKQNHKKGIALKAKLQRKKEAEARNAAYQKLSKEQKLAQNSTKVRAKIEKGAT